MIKARRKAMRSLLQGKVVNISDYRTLRTGRGSRKIALVSDNKVLVAGLKESLKNDAEVVDFEGRFSLEQALKSGEWDGIVLDDRTLKDDTLVLCEKLKRHGKFEDVFLMIVSLNDSKDVVRLGYEKGCDEWVTKPDSVEHVSRLLSQHLSI